MAGYEVVKVATDPEGGVDLDDLRSKADERTACLMLTNPNTLGLFDASIAEITAIVREAGGTLYYDGANLNAIMGHSRPGDMGFDIVHVNLHKSFSQPHGGGGPGAGPIAVSERIEPFLPVPRIERIAPDNGGRAELRAPWGRRAPRDDRQAARLPGKLRRLRPLLRLHPQPRRGRPGRGVGDRGPERQLPAGQDAAGTRRQVPPPRLRAAADARVRPLRQGARRRSWEYGPSTSPSGCWTTTCTRRRSTSRCWSTRR